MQIDSNNRTCNFCGRPGHLYAQCYKRLNGNNNNNPIKNRNVSTNNPKSCNYCKNVGHTFDECRKRQNNNRNRNVNNNNRPSTSKSSEHNGNKNNHSLNANDPVTTAVSRKVKSTKAEFFT
jgi:hypothetical protein